MTVGVSPEGQLTWSHTRGAYTIVEPSTLGIVLDEVNLGSGARVETVSFQTIDETYLWRGAHSIARNRCTHARINIVHVPTGVSFILDVRTYDDGVAFRYVLPEQSCNRTRRIGGESTSWQLPSATRAWHQTNTANYEGVHEVCDACRVNTNVWIGPPITLELPNGAGFAAVTEGGLFDYSGLALRHTGGGCFAAEFPGDPNGWDMLGSFASPWRITMATPDLDGLVNCDIVHNVCPPPARELADANWICPGRALWSWWSWFNGSLPYELPCDMARERHFIDRAAQLGFEYVLVDAGWEEWVLNGKDGWALLQELVEYGQERGVGIWVWRDHRRLLEQDERHRVLRRLSGIGVAGIKVDFMDSESKSMIAFYTTMLMETAAHRLMINFHGANKPAGQSRTWPNEMTREGIMGLEHNKGRGVSAAHNVVLPFTRLLAGHADYTPTTLTRDMLLGTTIAHQLALPVIILSPLTHYADHPDLYIRERVDDMLAAIPTCWDQTYVCPASRIGDCAVLARRAGRSWFVAAVNGDKRLEITVVLDFVEDPVYESDIFQDVQGKPQLHHRYRKRLHSGDVIHARLEPGGGMIAWMRPTDDKGFDANIQAGK